MSWWEVVLRVVLAGALLAAADAAVARWASDARRSRYDGSYRAPVRGELAALQRLVRRAGGDGGVAVAFLGASPTYGYTVAKDRDAIPAAYGRLADTAEGTGAVRVYNLASRGQQAGDLYLIARALPDGVDRVVVQLTYTSFDPGELSRRRLRFAQLPDALGVSVPGPVARRLGVPPSPAIDLDPALDRFATAASALYRERYAIVATAADGHPGAALGRIAARRVPGWPASDRDEETAPSPLPFDERDPVEQLIALDRFREATRFRLDRDDDEVVLVAELAALLRSRGIRAVFYLSPLNTAALDGYQMSDWPSYERNAAVLRSVIEPQGHRFLDYGRRGGLRGTDFTDITHTTDGGAVRFARTLYRDTAPYLLGSLAASSVPAAGTGGAP